MKTPRLGMLGGWALGAAAARTYGYRRAELVALCAALQESARRSCGEWLAGEDRCTGR